MKHLKTTAYHPQTNGFVERYKKITFIFLHLYVAEHRRILDLLVQPLTYAHNDCIHCKTGTTPFSLILSHQPPGPTTFVAPAALLTDVKSQNTSKSAPLLTLIPSIENAAQHRQANEHCPTVQQPIPRRSSARKDDFLHCPAQSTYAADKLAAEAYLK